MTTVILQARINSTRLPHKALKGIGGKPLVVRAMESLLRIPADHYVLACDPASVVPFTPLASSCGFTLISGSPDNVLERFCSVIRALDSKIVIRATADNPFVFADAAQAALARFLQLSEEEEGISYFGFDGLPYGAGVEIINAQDLLDAASKTDSSYDREHVGPALYNHTNRYRCIREAAPPQWYEPSVQISVDTAEDLQRVCTMAHYLNQHKIPLPASSINIFAAWKYAVTKIIFAPAVGPGKGSGHRIRAQELIRALRTNYQVSLVITDPAEYDSIPADLKHLTVCTLPASASLVVSDPFRSTKKEMKTLRLLSTVVALDDGGFGRDRADYYIDTIPSLPSARWKFSQGNPWKAKSSFPHANCQDAAFLPLPTRRRDTPVSTIKTVLVVAGGCNEAALARPVAKAAATIFSQVTVIDPANTPAVGGYTVIGLVENLREKLADYDLIITHYGLTAFEALAAGCRVILFSPTRYHWLLGKNAGFSVLKRRNVSVSALKKIVTRGISVPSIITPKTKSRDLAALLARLTHGRTLHCPLCDADNPTVIYRQETRTVAVCQSCKITYTCFETGRETSYNHAYFFEEYFSQYGKTYLDDFDSIKNMGVKRMAVIQKIRNCLFSTLPEDDLLLLDIGCAYGPFLSAAKDAGWKPMGTDVSEEAIHWVKNELGFPAVQSAFPAFNRNLLPESKKFAAVTLWYVIEHFEDLETVFEKIREILLPGGILAFSTPSGSGVSARTAHHRFLNQSPADHFTIWKPSLVRRQLELYGFRVIKIVSTGHHPERFPRSTRVKHNSFGWKIRLAISRLFRLGDTFEVYAIKRGTLEDAL